MVLRIRKLGLTVLATATLCSTISRLVAADPSVEVFTQDSVVTEDSTVTSAGRRYKSPPSASVSIVCHDHGGYDDNVSTTTGGAGSATTQANLTVSKDLSTARTQLSIAMRTGVVYYFDRAEAAALTSQAPFMFL